MVKIKKKKNRAGVVILVAVLCLALGAGVYIWWKNGSKGDDGNVAYVQSVAELAGLTQTGTVSGYAGVVQAKDIVKIDPENGMKVGECYVKAGDTVKAGTPLFRYDTAELTLAYEQLLIDIMGLENTIESDTRQIARLDKKLDKAKESAIYELELKRSEVSLELKKSQFELEEKRQKAETTKNAIDNAEVVSPCAGRVKSVKSDESSADPYAYLGNGLGDDAYITIISGSALWVKCAAGEQTVHAMSIGMRVKIHSRTDEDDVRTGIVTRIDLDTPESDNNNYYYDAGNGERATKYPFYVTVDDASGYLLGQHLVVKPDVGGDDKTGLWIPASFVCEENGKRFVFAANAAGRIEKRGVTVGVCDEQTDTLQITAGITASDRIAFPDETVRAGMKAEELSYADIGTDGMGELGYEEIGSDETDGYAYGDAAADETGVQ